MGDTCSEYANGQKIYVYANILGSGGLSAPAVGLYTFISP